MKRSRRWRQAKDMMNAAGKTLFSLSDALDLLKKMPHTKFVEALDISVILGVDVKQTSQVVRGVCALPHGTGKKVRVAVFCTGPDVQAALEAGADFAGYEDLAEQVRSGNLGFDRCVATPESMALVGQLGKILGPRGLMPNPKVGTVTTDVAGAVRAIKSGSVEFRTDKAGVIHASVGRVNFETPSLIENVHSFIEALAKARPDDAKGSYIKGAFLSSTMGPSVEVDLDSLKDAVRF